VIAKTFAVGAAVAEGAGGASPEPPPPQLASNTSARKEKSRAMNQDLRDAHERAATTAALI
jgi:hypothetical protein